MRRFRSEVGSGPGGARQERTFTGNEVLSGAAVSLCSRRAQLCLWLLFDPNGTQGGAVRLGGAGAGAQGTDGVVTGAAQAAFGGGGGERPRLVILAKGARAEVTEGRGRGAADAAVVPRTFPTSCTQTHRLSGRKSCSFKRLKRLALAGLADCLRISRTYKMRRHLETALLACSNTPGVLLKHTSGWKHANRLVVSLPYGGLVRFRHSRWYALGQSFLSHMTSSPPSPQQKQKYSCVCLPSGRSFRFFGFSLAFLAFSSFSITTALWEKTRQKEQSGVKRSFYKKP